MQFLDPPHSTTRFMVLKMRFSSYLIHRPSATLPETLPAFRVPGCAAAMSCKPRLLPSPQALVDSERPGMRHPLPLSPTLKNLDPSGSAAIQVPIGSPVHPPKTVRPPRRERVRPRRFFSIRAEA